MIKEKLVTQIALFQSQSQKRMENAINGSLLEIAELGHTHKGLKTWSDLKGGTLYWHAILEYEMTLETLIGKPTDDTLDKIVELKKYRINPNQSLNELGLIGVRAFIVQNNLFDLTFKESYSDLKKEVWDLISLDPDKKVSELEIPTMKMKLDFDNGN